MREERENIIEKPTDMEVALYYIRLLRSPSITGEALEKEKEIYAGQAAKALTKISNPFAIQLLKRELDKLNRR